jgi:hypothetical protein
MNNRRQQEIPKLKAAGSFHFPSVETTSQILSLVEPFPGLTLLLNTKEANA